MEVIGIYEVYVDAYFAENVLLDLLVLLSVAFLLGKRPALWRFALASLLGGAGAVLILCAGLRYGAAYLLSAAALDASMCLLLFSKREPQRGSHRSFHWGQLLVQLVYFQGLCFIYTKIEGCIAALGMTRFRRPAASALLVAAVALICVCKRKMERKKLYAVAIVEGGKRLDFQALFDTGNSLTDPYTGKPVAIVEENAEILRWLRDKPQKYRIIPFRSIGREDGILEGTEVEELIISREEGQRIERNAVIALYRGKLSGDGSFQMILNRSSI